MPTYTYYVDCGSTAGGTGLTTATTGADRAFASAVEAEATCQTNHGSADSSTIVEIRCGGSTQDTQAVTVDGWSGTPHIKFIGEASTQWSTSKYILDTNANALKFREANCHALHLQLGVSRNYNSHDYSGVDCDNTDSATIFNIHGCYIRCTYQHSYRRNGIWARSRNPTHLISNNIIDNFGTNSASGAIKCGEDGVKIFAYHNTIVNNVNGVYSTTTVSNVRLKNNLFVGNTHSVNRTSSYSFHADSDYNVEDLNETGSYLLPGSSSKHSQSIAFASSTDYSTSDTDCQVANNLYSDATIAITADLNGDARPSSGSVFAGADEGPAGITGTGAQALDDSTQTASGVVTVAGGSASTIDETVQVVAASLAHTGVGAQVVEETGQVASGILTLGGVSAQSLPAISEALSGVVENVAEGVSETFPVAQGAAGEVVVSGDIVQMADETLQAMTSIVPTPLFVASVNREFSVGVSRQFIFFVGG